MRVDMKDNILINNQFITDKLKKELLKQVVITNSNKFLSQLQELVDRYKIEETFLKELAETAGKVGRFSIVQYINNLSPNSIVEGSIAQRLLSCPHGEDIENLNIGDFFGVKSFSIRPSVSELVEIAKLILAAKFKHNEMLKKEKIPVSISVLNNTTKELDNFIERMIKLKKGQPFKTILTIADFHWATCYVEKDKDEKIKLFIFDSEGHDRLLRIRKKFFHLFPEQEVKVYISKIKIQHRPNYCQDFTIDTSLHLLSHYQRIFEFIEDPKHILSVNRIPNSEHEEIEVIPPPFLIRTKQKLNTRNEKNPIEEGGLHQLMEWKGAVYSDEEMKKPINKEGMDFWSSIIPHVEDEKNKRIDHKIDNAQNLLINYLIDTYWGEIQSEKEQFSLCPLNIINFEELCNALQNIKTEAARIEHALQFSRCVKTISNLNTLINTFFPHIKEDELKHFFDSNIELTESYRDYFSREEFSSEEQSLEEEQKENNENDPSFVYSKSF